MAGIERRERVVQRLIEEEMRESFLDYSMSVIVQRALPDVRDGLKPVHRRILYAMGDMGLVPGRPYKKSASVVGEVLGKYHPHGDTAVYDALVRMVQDFSLRYPLVDGQGNFGSVDGDNAAAYRYTEARLAPVALELLRDLDSDTVEWTDTFDAQRQEPDVLPALLPGLLVNGSSGIAVGMSTNVPPHNLREVAAAVRVLLENPDCTTADLMKRVPGPDFPTGGIIVTPDGIRDAYEKGRGRIVVRGKVHKELRRDGKEQLVVTELPYGVSKSKVIEQIADLVRKRKVEDVADLRDESDRDGMRITIELKRGAKPKPLLKHLFRQTYLQATFGAIMLALDHGSPKELTLKQILERYRDHRLEVIRRRSRHELARALDEAHIADGLLIALDDIDEVIALIRAAADRDAAAAALRKHFDLTEPQAAAILNMRLARLTALERAQLEARLAELRARIDELEELLGDVALQRDLLLAELDEVAERFGDRRRTLILDDAAEFDVPDLAAQEDWVVTLSHEGFVKRIPLNLYRRRVESGKPLAGMDRHEADFLERVFLARTGETLLVFMGDGRAHAIRAHDVPEAGRSSRGRSLHRLLEIEADVAIVSLISVSEFSGERYAVFATEAGTVKRTALDQFANVRAGGIAAINIRKGDRLLDVQSGDGHGDVVLATRGGRVIRFPEAEIAPMGRATQGVRGIQLRKGDAVVGMILTRRDTMLELVTENGTVKKRSIPELNLQKRGGLGRVGVKVDAKSGPVATAREVLSGGEAGAAEKDAAAPGAARRGPVSGNGRARDQLDLIGG